jgi:hypothetical protein
MQQPSRYFIQIYRNSKFQHVYIDDESWNTVLQTETDDEPLDTDWSLIMARLMVFLTGYYPHTEFPPLAAKNTRELNQLLRQHAMGAMTFYKSKILVDFEVGNTFCYCFPETEYRSLDLSNIFFLGQWDNEPIPKINSD